MSLLSRVKGKYTGIPTCRGAKLSAGGTKLCSWDCLGFGDSSRRAASVVSRWAKTGLPYCVPAASLVSLNVLKALLGPSSRWISYRIALK
ncbi:hypothetical protein ACYULU_10025 [Breznakiellaceae bacterium SP9]